MEMANGAYIDESITDSLAQYTLMKVAGTEKNALPEIVPTDDNGDEPFGLLVYKWNGEDEDVRDGNDLEVQMDGTRTLDRLVSCLSFKNPQLTFILDSASADVIPGDYLMPSAVDDGLVTKWVTGAGNRKIAKVLVGGTQGDEIVAEPVDEVSPA